MEKYRCSVCGYVHEGPLPEGFVCPVCKKPASVFEKIEEKSLSVNKYVGTKTEQNLMDAFAGESQARNKGSIIFFVGLPPRNVLICYAPLDRMEKQCCSFITDGEELKNNLLFLRQAT